MHYKFLSKIGDSYFEEEKTTGRRTFESTWNPVSNKLQAAIVDLRNMLQARPAAPAPAPGRRSVRDLVNFHQAQVDFQKAKQNSGSNEAAILAVQKKIELYRRWLSLEGVTADEDGKVPPANIEHRVVVYDKDAASQGMTQIHFSGGRLFTDAARNQPLDTSNMVTHFSGPGKAIYVMSETGNIHVSSHVSGNRHHSSLLGGDNVACGGELQVKAGRLIWLSNKTGHYRAKIPHLLQVLHQLQKKLVPMTFSLTVQPGNGRYPTVGAFIQKLEDDGTADYELVKLLQYNQHLTDDVLSTNRWRWRRDDEKDGVYEIASNRMVPHKEVRQWLKSTGRLADTKVKSGFNR
jgi:hypothetical protein